MKTNLSVLTTIAVLASALPVATQAATRVYDLSADWSDTQNPNGAWSYREGNGLLVSTPFPWVGVHYGSLAAYSSSAPVFTKSAINPEYQGGIDFGYLEPGDVLVNPGFGGNVLWSAPASGTISISGALWPVNLYNSSGGTTWTLKLDGSILSDGVMESSAPPAPAPILGSSVVDYTRSSPYDLSLGNGGAAALLDIPVAAGDQVTIEFSGEQIGLNFTITFTPDSADPSADIEQLAATVAGMNLQNGIENSLDAKLDSALNALDDVNENNDGAACNSLDAFINAVEAQRGNKLTNAQADQLIAAAQQIQAALNCGN